MLSDECAVKHITTLSGELDAILGGGIRCDEVTEVGESSLPDKPDLEKIKQLRIITCPANVMRVI